MIPLTLVTGFLGSGKTTLLARLARQCADRKVVFLVNEFSEVDVDGQILDLPADRLVNVVGGSIFCKCLVTDFIQYLKHIRDELGEGLDGVVIEASGIADPRVVRQMLTDTKLDHDYALARVISVVDPSTFEDLLETLPNIAAQIEASDLALLNKTDLFHEQTLAAVEERVRTLSPSITTQRCRYCDVELDLFTPAVCAQTPGEYAECADPRFATVSVRVRRPIALAPLLAALQPLGRGAYRVKGFVETDDGLRQVDSTACQAQVKPVTDRGQSRELVLIVDGKLSAAAEGLAARLRRGEFDVQMADPSNN